MPTPKKVEQVAQIKDLIETATIAISANNDGMSVQDMTDLRRALREQDVRFRGVKNNLAYIAADEANKPHIKDVITGPTGIAFGFDDPTIAAKALTQFITSNRAPMTIIGGILGDDSLTPEQVNRLATLPSKDQMIATLLGQLQAPIRNLAYVLNATQTGLVTALQSIVDQKGE